MSSFRRKSTSLVERLVIARYDVRPSKAHLWSLGFSRLKKAESWAEIIKKIDEKTYHPDTFFLLRIDKYTTKGMKKGENHRLSVKRRDATKVLLMSWQVVRKLRREGVFPEIQRLN